MSPLRLLREARGLSQLQVAARAEISIKHLRRIENNDLVGLTVPRLIRLAHSLRVSPAELFPILVARPPGAGRSPFRLG